MFVQKQCKHCSTDHPGTAEFWYKIGKSQQCKVYSRDWRRKRAPLVLETRREAHRRWVEINRERTRKYANKYYQKNREKHIQANWRYAKRRKAKDIQYRLAMNLRSRLNKVLKKEVSDISAVRHLGCTTAELVRHLESKFQPGMTWDNYGKTGWHVDHIKPLTRFDLTEETEVVKAVHYTNLQPLWAVDNIRKSNKEISLGF